MPFEGETMSTEREKIAAGEWYSCMDGELDILRRRARGAVHQHNTMPPDERGAIAPLLRALLILSGKARFSKRRFIALTALISRWERMYISTRAAPFSIPLR